MKKRTSYTLQEIEHGLRNEDYFYSSAHNGNEDAIVLLADSQMALHRAEPTKAQLNAMELVWKREHTLQEAGDKLGITPQGVRFNLQLLSVKLKKVVDEWAEREKRDR